MASAPPQPGLPLFYQQLEPLSSAIHQGHRMRQLQVAEHLVGANAIPLTIDEFAAAQRFFPIVFSVNPDSAPIALMGLNDGINTFVDDTGALIGEVYVPAYVRRYPFMLTRLRPEGDELSLCFDPTSPVVGTFEEGDPLFADGQPTPLTKSVLEFCEQFEQAVQRTHMFVAELESLGLLIDGELTIKVDENSQPAVYRGFKMVDEAKLRELRGDQMRKLAQSGALPIIYAHLMSLPLSREIFARQIQQGKLPQPGPADAPVPAPAPAPDTDIFAF